MWLLSAWSVAGMTEKWHFYFYLVLINLNNHMYPVATILDNIALR